MVVWVPARADLGVTATVAGDPNGADGNAVAHAAGFDQEIGSMATPARYCANCEFCGHELDVRAAGSHQWTSGWVMVREGGGGHGISLPKRENRWAHKTCVERAVKGHIGQQALL